MKRKTIITICIFAIFTLWGVFELITSESRGDTLAGIILLLLGVMGICYFLLDRKGNRKVVYNGGKTITDKRSTSVILLIVCLAVVIVGYLILPFHQVLDERGGVYTGLGWISSVLGILFGGAGVVVAIKRLIKPRIIMQISDKGLTVVEGFNKPLFIEWKNVQGVSKNDTIFFVHYQGKRNKQLRDAKIALSAINHYNIEQIESLIIEKINSQ